MVHVVRAARAILTPLVVAGLGLALLPRTAHAYVDPTSGSIILQVVAAGVLGAVLTVKQWWSKATALVRGLFGGRKSA